MKHVKLSILFSTIFFSNVFAQGTVPSLSSSIRGTVWQEQKPEDGVRQTGEATVPGILVKLLNADTGVLVATAISDANGVYDLKAEGGSYVIEYVFPTDGFTLTTKRTGSDDEQNSAANPSRFSDKFEIGDGETIDTYGLGLVARENTITNCAAKSPEITVWDEDLTIPKSNVSANPVSVKLYLNESVWHPTIGIENLGTAEDYDIVASGQVTTTLPNGEQLYAGSNIPKQGSLPAYDGITDFGGTSGTSWYNQFAYASSTYDYPAFLIAGTFVGDGQISFPTESKSYVGITGSGNQQTLVQTYVSAGVCAVYTYAEGTLPVKLISFKASKEGATANLTWKTTEEINSDRFEVERSNDGKQWQSIGVVSAVGESSAILSYNFTDNKPLSGANLYRLKMIDRDQTFAYSRISQLTFDGEATVYLYPNPVASQLFVQASSEEIASLQIFNQMGQLVKQVNSVKQAVDVSSLRFGTYAVRIVYDNGSVDNRSIVIAR